MYKLSLKKRGSATVGLCLFQTGTGRRWQEQSEDSEGRHPLGRVFFVESGALCFHRRALDGYRTVRL